MKLRNDFNEIDRTVWNFDWYCHKCGSNQGVSLHHILGRRSNSILNSFPLCDKCHRNYTLLDKSELVKYTIRFVLAEGYELKKRDLLFYKNNKNLYG